MPMTSDARRQLSRSIRALRERLLRDLNGATESAWLLSTHAHAAGLSQAAREKRRRLEAWMGEQARASGEPDTGRFRLEAEKQAAYTLLNRLVILKIMEATGLRRHKVVTGGWESRGYKDFRELGPALTRGDDSEGYRFLLELVFQELAVELPGLYGPAGVAELVPVPAATLRHVVEALDDEALASCWTDDMTLGWIYQYWNDPEREDLDAKLNAGGKVEPHEIASKTQMFTERYMVDWLLQNSLGPMWLAMCRKKGWTPEVEADGTLDRLEERRADWRAKRAAAEVSLTERMPLYTEAERRWACYVPQPIPEDAVIRAPDSVRELKLLDPAVGSGHFLVVAFGLLFALYQEEARHRGEAGQERWSERAIVESILENNLHGIDLDPRAVQIAAAALWLAAKQRCSEAQPRRLNLVASQLRLSGLEKTDPALLELRAEVEAATGIPGALTDTVVDALKGADHLGSLLKVGQAVEEVITKYEASLGRGGEQGDLLGGFSEGEALKRGILERLDGFLAKRTGGEDLGLRLRGEQLAAGVRFVELVKEGRYDLVVANPPYQGTSKMANSRYVEKHYKLGKADLYAAFLLRGLELVREGGVSAMLTMRNWMFIKQYSGLREHLLATHGLKALHDLSSGAFEEINPAQVVVSVVSSVFTHKERTKESIVLKSFNDQTVTQLGETERKRAATRCHEGRHTFDPEALKVVPEWPLVYWWDAEMLRLYGSAPLIRKVAPATFGATTGNNARFVRRSWEVMEVVSVLGTVQKWVPFINGAKGRGWIENLNEAMAWQFCGLAYRVFCEVSTGANFRSPHLHFRRGVAFSMIGAEFSARVHRYPSIFGNKGSSVFPEDPSAAVCAMNSRRARQILASLNPGIGFEVGDVNRLPLFPIAGADAIFAQLEAAFTLHESHREPSVEFTHPGPSPWRHAQEWAQLAVDRPEGAPLPEYTEVLDPEPPTDHLSFALGVALGRFGALGSAQEGILDPANADLSHALPAGILFLDGSLDRADTRDSLGHDACAPLHAAWETHGARIDPKATLRDYLRLKFFGDVHRQMYENRPIHWPLSSAKKTFVAWVTIHRWDEHTLSYLLADHLHPAMARLDGQRADLEATRDGPDAAAARKAEKKLTRLRAWREELAAFIADVEQCAERGPAPDAQREVNARYIPDLDDGVMINSAALWPLLAPQWKDPKKWWRELVTAKGRKDYDWSHLAMRYWPTRVDRKCQDDPSLGVAHGCFWRYHPERAWAWELRLQDEIGPDFRIEEAPYRGDGGHTAHRAAWLEAHPDEALAAVEKEAIRRIGRGKDKAPIPEMTLLETGLWSRFPAACWALETRIIEKQEAPFTLKAPDEPEARVAFVAANPEEAREREQLIAGMAPTPGLFDGLCADGIK